AAHGPDGGRLLALLFRIRIRPILRLPQDHRSWRRHCHRDQHPLASSDVPGGIRRRGCRDCLLSRGHGSAVQLVRAGEPHRLTLHSTFLPRWLGVVLFLAAGGLTFLYPPLARSLSSLAILSGVGEFLLVLWLLVKGVDEKRWYEQAAVAGLRA